MSEIKEYVCVNKYQKEWDGCHADYRVIKAKNRNQAKSIYSKESKTDYKEVSCVLKSNFVKL